MMIVRSPSTGPSPPPPLFITCPGTQNIQVTAPTTCTSVDLPEPQISGGVPPFTIQYNPADFSQFCVGTTPVLCIVTDNVGQQAQCNFNVIVTQVSPPAGIMITNCPFQSNFPWPVTGEYSSNVVDGTLNGVPGRTGAWISSGGFNNRAYFRHTWLNYATSGVDGEGINGYSIPMNNFVPLGSIVATDELFMRFRFRINSTLNPFPGGDLDCQQKFFITHRDVFDGDERMIAYFMAGSQLGQPNSSGVVFSVEKNIDHSNAGRVFIPLTTNWYHIQWSWRHSTSQIKVWLNNNNYAAPSSQATVPGTWSFDINGYKSENDLASVWNTGSRIDADFVIDIMDWQFAKFFDNTWNQ